MAIISYIFLHAALIPAFGGIQYEATGWAQNSFNLYQEICDLKRKTEQRVATLRSKTERFPKHWESGYYGNTNEPVQTQIHKSGVALSYAHQMKSDKIEFP